MISRFLSQEVPVYQAGLVFICLYLSIEYFRGDSSLRAGAAGNNIDNGSKSTNASCSTVKEAVQQTVVETTEAKAPSKQVAQSSAQAEADSEAQEYMDEEDVVLSVKNNYGMLDGPFKLMLCVNMSLNMGKGKIAAQCGHATLGAYIISKSRCPSALRTWSTFGQAKIAVKIEDEQAMYAVREAAQKAGLVTYIVADAGRTQIAAGSETVLAIGPAPESVLKTITGHLKLL